MVPPIDAGTEVWKADVHAMTPLLRLRIETLRLRDNAPFPSQVKSAHDFIRRWRYEQRLSLVRGCGSADDSRSADADDYDPDVETVNE